MLQDVAWEEGAAVEDINQVCVVVVAEEGCEGDQAGHVHVAVYSVADRFCGVLDAAFFAEIFAFDGVGLLGCLHLTVGNILLFSRVVMSYSCSLCYNRNQEMRLFDENLKSKATTA